MGLDAKIPIYRGPHICYKIARGGGEKTIADIFREEYCDSIGVKSIKEGELGDKLFGNRFIGEKQVNTLPIAYLLLEIFVS